MNRIIDCVFAALFAVSALAPCASAKASPPKDEKAQLKILAARVVDGLNGPFSKVLEFISPAALPDATDYILNKPAGIDISILFDSFKDDYCAAVPNGIFPARTTGESVVEIEDWTKTFKKSQVWIPNAALRNTVKSLSKGFVSARDADLIGYTVDVSRKATVKMNVDFAPGAVVWTGIAPIPAYVGGPCQQAVFEIEFVEHSGIWKLFHVKRRESDQCLSDPSLERAPGMKPTPYYEDCLKN